MNPAEPGRSPNPSLQERRRCVRQKVHSPAYASLSGNSSSMALDLSEVIDLSEQGLCMQSSSPLTVGSEVNLCLDLSETKAHIYTTGSVVWTGASGRTGLHFPSMPDSSLRQLREWLFLNMVVACVNHVAARAVVREELHEGDDSGRQAAAPGLREAPDYTSILSGLAAVQREVALLGADLEGALTLLAERSLAFTGASGAAIALGDGKEMVCRASSGEDAPGPGVRLQVESGFSGECVRSGRLMRCDDSETDPYVDRETCQALGIRSILAAPVISERAVIGIVEVFAGVPQAFSGTHVIIVQRMSEYVAEAVERSQGEVGGSGRSSLLEETNGEVPRTSSEAAEAEDLPGKSELKIRVPAQAAPYFRRGLQIAVIATLLFAGAWIFYPRTGHKSAEVAHASSVAAPKTAASVPALSFDGLRALAQKGDAPSQFAVGVHYATGEDVPQDYSEAVQWFGKAAEQGHVVAQATLGAYYWAGRGVPQDMGKAYFWSVLAQAGGDEASKYRVAVLASRMTRSQTLAAQQQANDWLKQHQVSSQSPAGR
jgi:hypothetical protein